MNPSKASIRHLGEGFSFLGWSVHAGGRRAGAKAREGLRTRIDEARADAPDPDAAVERVLRGWITYYGSLSGVTDQLRAHSTTVAGAHRAGGV